MDPGRLTIQTFLTAADFWGSFINSFLTLIVELAAFVDEPAGELFVERVPMRDLKLSDMLQFAKLERFFKKIFTAECNILMLDIVSNLGPVL